MSHKASSPLLQPVSKAERVCMTLRAVVAVFVAIMVALVASCVVSLVLFPLCSKPTRQSCVASITNRIFGFVALSCSSFWKLDVRGNKSIQPKGALIMCNHISLSDIVFVLASVPFSNFRIIGKSSIFRIPFLGWIGTLSGHVPVYRRKGSQKAQRGTIKTLMNSTEELLASGVSILVFPEGTRSRTGELQDLKMGFIRLAHETKAPILPMTIWGSQSALKVGEKLCDKANVTFTIGNVIETDKFEDAMALKDRLRNEFISQLKEVRPHENKSDDKKHEETNSKEKELEEKRSE